jgi:tRNA (guanine-N7-)-methyltransferase
MTRSTRVRPVTSTTSDGRPLQEVTSYARRGSRLSPRLQRAWERHADAWLIQGSVADAPPLDVARLFGCEAPVIVEIGSGTGEALAQLAAARPSYNVLGLEVWRPGVARTFLHLERAGVDNVRMLSLDGEWALEHLFGPGQLAELWTFFPDPWHKKRHHKRRLVSAAFAALVASRLEQGAAWRLATDWPDYAEHIETVLGAEPSLLGGRTERWAERPMTKFERRAVHEGRSVVDFCYRRV